MHGSIRIPRLILACCLLAAASTHSFAQEAAPAKPAVGTPIPPPTAYGNVLNIVEKEVVGAAEAMPEDKYNFAPPTTYGEYKGVRTFADQVRHLAMSNGYFFHDPTKPMVDNRADFDKLKTKAELVKALKDSLVMAHAYVDSITTDNAFIMTTNGTRAGTASFGMAHMMDHYGQMVEYLRMNSIVPPASRGSM
ncbi:MAG: DinB family protein [Terracidiphilus sp.]